VNKWHYRAHLLAVGDMVLKVHNVSHKTVPF